MPTFIDNFMGSGDGGIGEGGVKGVPKVTCVSVNLTQKAAGLPLNPEDFHIIHILTLFIFSFQELSRPRKKVDLKYCEDKWGVKQRV